MMAVRDHASSYLSYTNPQMSSKHQLINGGQPWLINDPSMQGLHLNHDIGGTNFRKNNNNTLHIDEGGGGFDTMPQPYQSSVHLRKGSMQGFGGRTLLSQNGSTIMGAQSNMHLFNSVQ